jgi:hypothetical protein
LIKALDAGSDLTINAKILSTSGPVTIFATDIVTLSSVIVTTGVVNIDTSATGNVVFSKPESLDANQNINVVANSVDITTLLASNGSLVISPLQPASGTAPVGIVVGGTTQVSGWLHLNLTEIGLIQDGFTDITLGSGVAMQTIVVNGVDGTVAFKDPLIIDASGTSNQVNVSGSRTGDSLTVLGSLANTTTTLKAADISMAGNVTVNGLIQVEAGANVITAGNTANDGVTGSLTITGNIAGSADTGQDLTLVSEGNVLVTGTISGIDALTVTAATDVTFNDTVAVTGNLVVNAAGAVKFDKSLTLTNGGTLTIQGASSVEFASGAIVQVDGNLTIDAQMLKLLGGADSLYSTRFGSTLTLTSASTSNNIVVGSTVGHELADALNLTTREVDAIGENFAKVVIGDAGLGVILVVGNTDLRSVEGASIEMWGNTIGLLAGNAGGAVQVPVDVSLHATGNIVLNSGISTATTNKVILESSGGSITMAQGTRLDSAGGDIALVAKALAVATINAWSADLTVGGVVKLDAGSGTIVDANKNSTADIFAKAVNLTGYGPATTSSGDVLEVVADVVQISVPQGLVVRDTGANGRTYFNVMNGGKLYRQMVVEGTNVTRVTEDPADLLTKDDAALIAAGVPRNSYLLQAPEVTQSSLISPQSFRSMAVSVYLAPIATTASLEGSTLLDGIYLSGSGSSDLLSDSSYGLASRLQYSYILGTPGEQPLISGLDTFSQDNFEYWVDTLSL